MLEALHVHNFALLEDAKAEFSQGFNLFTGETGSGKSILIDAFGLVLGGRGSVDFVRKGTEGLWVQAVFDISTLPKVKSLLEEQGLEVEEELFLKRQLNAQGKSRAYVNGIQVPVSLLRQLGAMLVDIHGQHENQALLKPDAARFAVDSFLGEPLKTALAAYKGIYDHYLVVNKKLEALQKANDNKELLLDRYAWEIREINQAKLKAGEEEQLQEEAKLLQHGEKIIRSLSEAHSLLEKDKGVLELLAEARSSLQIALRYDQRLEGLYAGLDAAWINLEDCRGELADYLSSNDFNEERAQEVQQRLDLYYRLHKKYGGSTEAVLAYLEKVINRYKELQDIEAAQNRLEKELKLVLKELTVAAEKLTLLRSKGAKALGEAITRHIHDLAMPNGVLEIRLEPAEAFTALGKDELYFSFSANLGEPLNALEKVASGGELSRIALAYKTAMLNQGSVATMVFDEIDTGVGGVTAQKMAEKLAIISRQGQVLCITHLPQIAAFADNHLYIEKQTEGARTVTKLLQLQQQERAEELVRMAGGNNSSAAKANAKELLEKAIAFKAKL